MSDLKTTRSGRLSDENDKKHRLNRPAIIQYYPNGNVECEKYIVDDKRRVDIGTV